MSVGPILTLGLGAFTGGGVEFIPTLGFGTQGTAPPPVVVTTEYPAGRPKRRVRLYRVRVKDKSYVFDNVDSLISFLAREELREEKRAVERAKIHARRIARVGKAEIKTLPPRVRITSRVDEIADYVRQLQAKIDGIYWNALAVALGEEEDEEMEAVIIAAMLEI